MNARRIHALMRERFPSIEHVSREWIVVQDEHGARADAVSSLLATYVGSTDPIVEVHRKLGAVLPLHEAASFVAAHMGQGEIRVANREFSGFVVVSLSGVAAGWRPPSFSKPEASGMRAPPGETARSAG